MALSISLILSTYNSPAWLEKVLWGFSTQTYRSFEIVIADDGSGDETRQLIERMRPEVGIPIRHVWHEDRGFQKSEILNKGIVASAGEYLVFTDGDCIPRKDFIEVHAAQARSGYFLSGGYVKLPLNISQMITEGDVRSGRAFDAAWLRAHGMRDSRALLKLRTRGMFARLLDALTPTTPSWNGHNASGWKRDVLGVNGFDERMQYGGQDRELGERMVNAGIKPLQIRYRAACVHLDHGRGYRTEETMARNAAIRQETRSRRVAWTTYGIEKRPAAEI